MFWPFFGRRLLPIPADIIAGLYYPWLDYKWGYTVGVPVKNPLISDIPSLLYPWRTAVINELAQGRLPFWNPYYFGGMPLLANFQSAAFSYVNLFFLFFPASLAWSLGIILSPFLTMLACFWFFREQKLSRLSAVLGAIVFSLSGFQIAWLEYNVHGHTVLFLPLILLSLQKILENKGKIWYPLLAVFIAGQIFAGYQPVVIYSYLICLFFVIYFYFLPQLKGRKIAWKKYLSLTMAVGTGWLIALPQLLPGLELAKNSIRAIDPLVVASNASYLPLKNFLTLLAPDFFGNPATGNYFGQAFYDNFYFFVGTGTLFLVLFSLFFFRQKKVILFWWLILFFSLVLVLKNPLGLFLERILFLSGGVAARALFMTDFALAALAAWGMEMFQETKRKWPAFLTVIFWSLAFAGLFLVSRSFTNTIHRQVSQRNLLIPLFFFGLSTVVFLIRILTKAGERVKSALAFLLILLVSSQLLYSARKYLPFSSAKLLFPSTPVIDFLKGEQMKSSVPFRVELGEVIPQNFLMPYGLETVSGYDALLPKRMGEFLSFLETGKMPDKISRVHLIRNYQSPLFPLLNVKYVLAKKVDENGQFSPVGKPPTVFLNSDFRLVFEDKTVQVYENLNFLPRAFWVHQAKVIKDLKLPDLVSLKIDWEREIVLEEDSDFSISKEAIVNRVDWREYRPGKIILSVESDQPGFVFLANNFYPGWQVSVDGRKEKIYRANYTFQAVKVDKGEHQLIFQYSPFSLKLN